MNSVGAGGTGRLGDEAYLLHRRPYRESSLIAEVLTREHGRMAFVCRGARRPRSGLRAIDRPFARLCLTWRGSGDLATLCSVERLAFPRVYHGDVLFSALYMNELLLRLLHRHDPCPEVFDLYEATLGRLDEPVAAERVGLQRILRAFECRLLARLGYGLVLDHDVESGAPIVPDRDYDYLPHRGPVEAGRGVAGAGGEVRVRGETLLALADGDLADERSLGEARRLMRANLLACLGGRPLRSWSLIEQVRSRPSQRLEEGIQ